MFVFSKKILLLIGVAVVFIAFFVSLTLKHSQKNSLVTQGNFFYNSSSVPMQYQDKNFFLSAIKQSKAESLNKKITGITVPHHLLAKGILANVFTSLSGNNYNRVIIFSPDHFYLGKTKISYSNQSFETVFGRLELDQDFTKKLSHVKEVGQGDFFYREHGINAVLPFVKYFFPNAKIVVMDLSVNSSPKDLAGLVTFLNTNLDESTLVIQSTDFSHYLTVSEADKKDEQTINLLNQVNAGTLPAEDLFKLVQPDNLDCIACQYLQTKIQKEFYGSNLHITDHKNSQSYSKDPVKETTSYIPQIYYKD